MKKINLMKVGACIFGVLLTSTVLASTATASGGDNDSPKPSKCPGGVELLGVCFGHQK